MSLLWAERKESKIVCPNQNLMVQKKLSIYKICSGVKLDLDGGRGGGDDGDDRQTRKLTIKSKRQLDDMPLLLA